MDVAVEIPIWSGPRSIRSTLNAYISLMKPRVIELLLLVTVPTMFLAENGVPSLWLVLAMLVGGALSAGSAGAFNCYIDRDIDRVMRRTQGRPLVTGELTDRQAFVFAWALGVASIAWLWAFTNWLAAALSLGAILLYVVFYTMILKRRTAQNIVWGGVAEEPAYWRDGYRPHLTLTPVISIEDGGSRILRCVAVARLLEDDATVVAAFRLPGH